MKDSEIKAMKNDLPFYVQKIVNMMMTQLPMMPNAETYDVSISKRYGWVATVRDNEDGFYFIHPGGEVNYKPAENKLSLTAATMRDETQITEKVLNVQSHYTQK